MRSLKGEKLYLRALEPEDLEFLSDVENDLNYWHLSHTQMPFSRYILQKYLQHAHQDIYEAKQLRLVISTYEDIPAGFIDLYDFDFKNQRAGLGIIIIEEFRGLGYASEALKLLCDFAFTEVQLHQLYACINSDNYESLALFNKHNFVQVGLKKDWNFHQGKFQDEYLLQKINNVY